MPVVVYYSYNTLKTGNFQSISFDLTAHIIIHCAIRTQDTHMKIPETYDELRGVPKEQLPLLWLQITHNPTNVAPKHLIRPLWYRIQCMRHNCQLPQKYITRLNKYAKDPDAYMQNVRRLKYELKPGTVIRKTYKGQLFILRVIDDHKFEYNGKTYPSLSAAAYAMIGMKVSGTDFFGLNNKSVTTS